MANPKLWQYFWIRNTRVFFLFKATSGNYLVYNLRQLIKIASQLICGIFLVRFLFSFDRA